MMSMWACRWMVVRVLLLAAATTLPTAGRSRNHRVRQQQHQLRRHAVERSVAEQQRCPTARCVPLPGTD